MNRTSTLPDMSIAIAALTTRADGTIDDPQTDEEWKAWVSASTTRNHLKGDPLLDWLHRYGQANGFQPDDQIEGSDPRTDFLAFIFEQGQRFEDGATPSMAQVWVYNEALGRIQGYRPPAAYLLGRRWKTGWTRGESCFERLARVDHDAIGDQQTGATLADLTGEAIDWIRRMRAEGAAWRVLPEPSVPELYPNARSGDAP